MATIRRRGKYWEAQVRLYGVPNRSASFDSQREARDWARRIENEIRKGRYQDTRVVERTTVGEALERYSYEILDRQEHAWREKNRANRLRRYEIASYSLANVTSREIAEFVSERQDEGRTANTIRLDLALLRRMFEVARKDWGWPVANPVKEASKPKLPPGRDRRLQEANEPGQGEEQRLLAACPPEFAAVVRWALETAMRRGEIAELRWEHINRTRRTAYLPKTKNGRARSVPLSSRALGILDEIPRRLDGAVFGMTSNAIGLAMRRATRKAGIEGLRFHDLRHEAISRYFENTDLDSLEIARITGHRTMQMLERYTHLRADRLAERLDGAPRVK